MLTMGMVEEWVTSTKCFNIIRLNKLLKVSNSEVNTDGGLGPWFVEIGALYPMRRTLQSAASVWSALNNKVNIFVVAKCYDVIIGVLRGEYDHRPGL